MFMKRQPHSQETKDKISKDKISKAKIGYKHSDETKKKIGDSSRNRKRQPCSEETKRKISAANMGRKISKDHREKISAANKGKYGNRTGVKLSKESREKISKNRKNKLVGSDNPSWKGGITNSIQKIRNTPEYSEWREHIVIRDNHTCRYCGNTDVKLHVHHILDIHNNIGLVLNPNNGVTLCIPCHRKQHRKENNTYA